MDISRILKNTDGPIGRLSNWIGVVTFFAAIVGAISWPTSTIESVSKFGWGGIFIVALLLTCLFLTSSAAFLVAFRKFKPLPLSAITEQEKPFQEVSDINKNATQLRELKSEIEQQISNQNKEFAKRFKEISDVIKYLENTMVSTQEKSNDLRNDVRSAFSAHHSQNIYNGLVGDIDKLIDKLSDPADKEAEFPNWQTWTLHYERLKSQLNRLTHLVEEYIDVREAIFNVLHEKYKSHYWKFNDNGLSDDQKHDYKTFRIIAANYYESKSKMYSAILNAVYRGF